MLLLMRWCACVLLLGVCASAQDNTNRNFHFEDRSYFLVDAPSSWNDSIKVCQQKNASLTVITSTVEAEDVKKIMMAYNLASIHTGFHDVFTEGDYVTVYGETLVQHHSDLTAWAPGFPRASSKHNCGGFSMSGFMDVDCDDVRPFICAVHRKRADEFRPLPGYTYIAGHGYYKQYTAKVTWVEAEKTCRREGSHLAVINSQEEVDALEQQFSFAPALFRPWVGVHRFFGGDDDFVTLLGGTVQESGYSKWYAGEPSGTCMEWPVVFYIPSGSGSGLATTQRTATLHFICEQDVA